MPWRNTSKLKSPVAGLALAQFPGRLDWEDEGRPTTSRRTILHCAKEKRAWASLGFFETKRPLLALPEGPLLSLLLLYFGSWRLQDFTSTFIFLLVSLSWWVIWILLNQRKQMSLISLLLQQESKRLKAQKRPLAFSLQYVYIGPICSSNLLMYLLYLKCMQQKMDRNYSKC